MKVLITGGAGYNGSILSLELAEAGHEVTCLDLRGMPPGWKFWRHEKDSKGQITFLKADILDSQLVQDLVPKYEAIVHLAFIVGGPACKSQPELARSLAIQGTSNILEAMTKQLLVFSSTDSVYGNKAQGKINEDFLCEPASYYGELKLRCEKMIQSSGKNYVIIRIPSNFGVSPLMRDDQLVHFLVSEMAHTGQVDVAEGHVTRTLIHVRDVALAIRHILENQAQVAQGIYNIAGCCLTKSEMAKIIAAIFGGKILESDFHDPEARDFILDCARFAKTCWLPRYTFTDGVTSLKHHLEAIARKD